MFLGVSLYISGRKSRGFLVFFFFLSKGYGLLGDSWLLGAPLQTITDFALLYIIVVFIINIKNKEFYRCDFRNYRWILILFIYISFELCFTIVQGKELLSYSLKVYRNYIPLLSFYLIQELGSNSLKFIIKRISVFVMIMVVLHSLQALLGVQLLFASSILEENNGMMRYSNIPELSFFILIYLSITLSMSNIKGIWLLLFCLASLILSQHRGPMIGYVLVISLYLFLERKGQKIIGYGVVALFVVLVAGSYIGSRFSDSDTGADIRTVFSMNATTSYDQYDRRDMGNFTFRVLLLGERIAYLVDNPKYLITGVGMRHEDSPNTKEFNFQLGTAKIDDSGNSELLQIISGDVAWQTPLMLLGLMGIFLYLKFSFMNVRFLYKCRKMAPLFMAAFLYYVYLFIVSFKNDFVFSPLHITFLVLVIELARKYDKGSEIVLFNH